MVVWCGSGTEKAMLGEGSQRWPVEEVVFGGGCPRHAPGLALPIFQNASPSWPLGNDPLMPQQLPSVRAAAIPQQWAARRGLNRAQYLNRCDPV